MEGDEQLHHEWDTSVQPSTAVVEAVAAMTDRDPLEMPRIYDQLHTDSLDSLLTSTRSRAGGQVEVSFSYDDIDVHVSSDGDIRVACSAD
jgi:hypothetical protein